MLPYQEDGKKLEELLEKLFVDNESTPEDVKVWRGSSSVGTLGNCCNYSYGSYDD